MLNSKTDNRYIHITSKHFDSSTISDHRNEFILIGTKSISAEIINPVESAIQIFNQFIFI